jgi:hypothetical protein
MNARDQFWLIMSCKSAERGTSVGASTVQHYVNTTAAMLSSSLSCLSFFSFFTRVTSLTRGAMDDIVRISGLDWEEYTWKCADVHKMTC